MNKMNFANKLLSFLISAVILLNPIQSMAMDEGQGSLVDESIQDLSLVLGSGAVGAILGLSTLSFVEKPKDHFKNVAIGGAIGVVVGVGIVLFGQATKSQTSIVESTSVPMDSKKMESLERLAFSQEKIAADYLMQPTFDFTFSF